MYKRIVARSGVTPRCVQQLQLTEAIIELVKAGLGVAILSEWAVAPHLRSRALRAVRLTKAGHRRRWSAVTLRETSNLAYVSDFIRLMAINAPRPAIAAGCRRQENAQLVPSRKTADSLCFSRVSVRQPGTITPPWVKTVMVPRYPGLAPAT